MAQVISEARKALREKARSKRQGMTDLEMIRAIQKKTYRYKSEREIYGKLGENDPERFTTPGGYQRFAVDEKRILAVSHLRDFYFPGYGTRPEPLRCLTPMELNVALGMPESAVRRWLVKDEFPVPLGVAYAGTAKRPTPCYTVLEAFTYAIILENSLGKTESHDYWSINKANVIPQLFAAKENCRKIIFEEGGAETFWRVK